MQTTINCSRCDRRFNRPLGRINEANKFGWKQYCSALCQSEAKNKHTIANCANTKCQKLFPMGRGKKLYCSRSCAVAVNNAQNPKKKAPIKYCPICQTKFKGASPETFCSLKCKARSQIVSRSQIISEIQEFFKINDRIPHKHEFSHATIARRNFSSWNKAIIKAGYKPNDEKFTHKYTARDGHICDSLAEKIIDDWMFKRNISHQRSVYYPNQKRFKTDFLVENKYWIEFLGLKGVLKRYDNLYKQKLEVAKINKIKIIELNPKDLFPVNRLNQKLEFLMK